MKTSPMLFATLLFAFAARADETFSVSDSASSSAFSPPKDAAMAYTITSAATLLPIIASAFLFRSDVELGAFMTAGAIFVGPSAGQFYAGSYGTGLIGVGARTLGAYLFVESVFSCFDRDPCNDGGTGVLGIALFVGGIGYSLVDTYFAVKRANARALKSHKAAVKTSFAPALFPVGEGRFAPGLAFNGSF